MEYIFDKKSDIYPVYFKDGNDKILNKCSYVLDLSCWSLTDDYIINIHAYWNNYYSKYDYYPEKYPYWYKFYQSNGVIILIVLSGLYNCSEQIVHDIAQSNNFKQFQIDLGFRKFDYFVNTKHFLSVKSAAKICNC